MEADFFKGYKFKPSDEDLIKIFLHPKVLGLPLPRSSNRIIQRSPYGNQSPWEIFNDQDPWTVKRKTDGQVMKVVSTIYVFTTRNVASAKKFSRTAGCGTWHGNNGPEAIWDVNNDVIGSKKNFTFKVTDLSAPRPAEMGHWIMHEYSVADSTLIGQQGEKITSSYVLCKIRRYDSKAVVKKDQEAKEENLPTKKIRVRAEAALTRDDSMFLVEEAQESEEENLPRKKTRVVVEAAPTEETVPQRTCTNEDKTAECPRSSLSNHQDEGPIIDQTISCFGITTDGELQGSVTEEKENPSEGWTLELMESILMEEKYPNKENPWEGWTLNDTWESFLTEGEDQNKENTCEGWTLDEACERRLESFLMEGEDPNKENPCEGWTLDEACECFLIDSGSVMEEKENPSEDWTLESIETFLMEGEIQIKKIQAKAGH